MVKNLAAMQETWVWPLGQEDPPEKGMATHSSIAWRTPWTEEPGGFQSTGLQRVRQDWVTNTRNFNPVLLTVTFFTINFSSIFYCKISQYLISGYIKKVLGYKEQKQILDDKAENTFIKKMYNIVKPL